MWHVCGRVELHNGFWWENLREGGYLEDPSVDERIILKLIFKKWYEGFDLIDVAQDRDGWRAVVNAVLSIRIQ
jgi:hypothetical protein